MSFPTAPTAAPSTAPTVATVATAVIANEATRAASIDHTQSTGGPSTIADQAIDRSSVPRMPWQDMAIGVGGCAARDIALHFICRWNHHRTFSLSENNQLRLPILLPFSDNLDTDYSVGWPLLGVSPPPSPVSSPASSTAGVNTYIPSLTSDPLGPTPVGNSSIPSPSGNHRVESTQSSAGRYTIAGMGENVEKALAEEVCPLFTLS